MLTLLVVPVTNSYLAKLEAVSWADALGFNWNRLRAGVACRFGPFWCDGLRNYGIKSP